MRFKLVMLAAVLLLASAANAIPDKPKSADALMQGAYSAAKQGKKPVLVIFGATW